MVSGWLASKWRKIMRNFVRRLGRYTGRVVRLLMPTAFAALLVLFGTIVLHVMSLWWPGRPVSRVMGYVAFAVSVSSLYALGWSSEDRARLLPDSIKLAFRYCLTWSRRFYWTAFWLHMAGLATLLVVPHNSISTKSGWLALGTNLGIFLVDYVLVVYLLPIMAAQPWPKPTSDDL